MHYGNGQVLAAPLVDPRASSIAQKLSRKDTQSSKAQCLFGGNGAVHGRSRAPGLLAAELDLNRAEAKNETTMFSDSRGNTSIQVPLRPMADVKELVQQVTDLEFSFREAFQPFYEKYGTSESWQTHMHSDRPNMGERSDSYIFPDSKEIFELEFDDENDGEIQPVYQVPDSVSMYAEIGPQTPSISIPPGFPDDSSLRGGRHWRSQDYGYDDCRGMDATRGRARSVPIAIPSRPRGGGNHYSEGDEPTIRS